MSIAHVKDRDTLITCPYNSSHRVSIGRMPIHLMKCKKNVTNQQFVSCPFNASHHIPLAERPFHISTCPDKAYVERQLVYTAKLTSNALTTKVPPYEDDLPESSENWDLEGSALPVAGYDPTQRMNEQTFRNPQTFSSMTRSEKKHYRHARNKPTPPESVMNGDDDEAESLIPAFSELRMPKQDGAAALQAFGRGQHPSSSATSSLFGERLKDEGLDNEAIFAICKGRGISQRSVVVDTRPGSSTFISSDNEDTRSVSERSFVMKGRGRGWVTPSPSPKVGGLKDKYYSDRSYVGKDSANEENEVQLSPKSLKNHLQKNMNQVDILSEKQKNVEAFD